DRDNKLKAIATALKASPEEAVDRVAVLMDERKKLERELTEAKKALALAGDGGGAKAAETETVGDVAFSGQVIQGLNPKELRGLIDQAKKQLSSGVSALVAVNDGRATVAVGVTDDLTERFSAVDLVQAGVAAVGGKGGGGRLDMAQGGGPDGAKGNEAIAAIKTALAG
ncbi:MAG: DHHA1 domain-containing protein, partial [Parasphingorhabdus sp.]